VKREGTSGVITSLVGFVPLLSGIAGGSGRAADIAAGGIICAAGAALGVRFWASPLGKVAAVCGGAGALTCATLFLYVGWMRITTPPYDGPPPIVTEPIEELVK
jgi:hypothetical protein